MKFMECSIIWVPEHCGLRGNEDADRIAGNASDLNPVPFRNISLGGCPVVSNKNLRR